MKSITPAGLFASLLALSLTSIASAQTADSSQSETVDALLECRSETREAERLGCLDDRLAAFAEAMTAGQLVIIERDSPQMAETVADAVVTAQAQVVAFEPWDDFGFSKPRILPADRARGGDTANIEVADGVTAEVDNQGRVSSVTGLDVRSVALDANGRTVVRLTNGQVWRQTDETRVQVARDRDWENGVTATVETGFLGAYFLKLSYSRGRFRVERVR